MDIKDLLDREVTIKVDGLVKPVGGRLIGATETLLTLKPSIGNNNVLVIPMCKITSIMYTERGTDDRDRKNTLC